jgi:hypothetical protein
MSTPYERLNIAQSAATGLHGKLIRLVSRIAMLILEVPAAMRSNDWPEQRRIRGDLDEALLRLRESVHTAPPATSSDLQTLLAVGSRAVAAIVITPRGSERAIEEARSAAADAELIADSLTKLLDSGSPESSLLDS